jgi:ABC-type phosphate transport system substrate-binding protein
VELSLDGEKLGDPFDLYSYPDVVTTGVVVLGVRELDAGKHRLTVKIVGANPSAQQAYMFGLDYLLVNPTDVRFDDDEARIVVGSRANNTGAYAYFQEAVLGKDGRFRGGIVTQVGSKDLVELVAKTRTVIGFGPAPNDDGVKVLKLSTKDGAVAPSAENVKAGKYPLARPIYIYTAEPAGALKHYLQWLRTKEARTIAEKEGYVPYGDVQPAPEEQPPAAKLAVAGSDTMVNAGAAWAEAYGKQHPAVAIEISGGGTGVGIARLIDGSVDMAHATRAVKPAEQERIVRTRGAMVEHTIAYDVLHVFVHKDNPLDAISIDQLREIYRDGGSITSWGQLNGGKKKAAK